jgi:hypothetical protein
MDAAFGEGGNVVPPLPGGLEMKLYRVIVQPRSPGVDQARLMLAGPVVAVVKAGANGASASSAARVFETALVPQTFFAATPTVYTVQRANPSALVSVREFTMPTLIGVIAGEVVRT